MSLQHTITFQIQKDSVFVDLVKNYHYNIFCLIVMLKNLYCTVTLSILNTTVLPKTARPPSNDIHICPIFMLKYNIFKSLLLNNFSRRLFLENSFFRLRKYFFVVVRNVL